MKRLSKAAVVVFLAMALLAAGGKSDKTLGKTETLKGELEYRVRYLKDPDKDFSNRRMFRVNEFSCWAEISTLRGDSVIVFHRQDRTRDDDLTHWKFYTDIEKHRLLRKERKIISRSGEVLAESVENYNYDFYDYPAPNAHFHQVPILGSFIDFEAGNSQKIWMVFSVEFTPFYVTAVVEGTEKIKVPAGEFECYKIELRYAPDTIPIFKLLPSYFAEKLIPSYYLWVDKNAPHTMVRFQGKLEGMTSPEQAQELVKIHES